MDTKKTILIVLALVVICTARLNAPCKAEQCGSQGNWALCGDGSCCSEWGWCGSGNQFCGQGCQSGPCAGGAAEGDGDGDGEVGDVGSIVTDSAFNKFLSQRNAGNCPAKGFYTRSAFLSAASAFKGFGTAGDATTQKRELAAFFANIAHESGSGCYKEEINKSPYCDSKLAPCAPGKQYYGRGPIQISWNYNYQAAGKAIGFDGIKNPDIVASDPVISFKTAVWYWMTQHSPTCHSIMVNNKGFGATINAINGGLECGPKGNQAQQKARIELYKSFCSILGVNPGNNLTC